MKNNSGETYINNVCLATWEHTECSEQWVCFPCISEKSLAKVYPCFSVSCLTMHGKRHLVFISCFEAWESPQKWRGWFGRLIIAGSLSLHHLRVPGSVLSCAHTKSVLLCTCVSCTLPKITWRIYKYQHQFHISLHFPPKSAFFWEEPNFFLSRDAGATQQG